MNHKDVKDSGEDIPQLVRVSRDRSIPLSLAQEAIWPYCQTHAAYVAGKVDQFIGPLDVPMLRDSLSYIVRRHEVLRTTFATVDGQPIQTIHAAEPISFSLFQAASQADAKQEAIRIIKDETSRTSDLNQGPLFRFSLLRISDNEHWLFRTVHHLLWDAWSTRVFHQELTLLYKARHLGRPPPLRDFEPLQYADYTFWQRKVLRREGPVYREAIAWWEKYLQGEPPEIELPFKRPRPRLGLDPTEGLIELPVDSELAQCLNRLSRSEATTPYLVWLAGLAALLAVETGQSDVVIGTYMTSRRRHPALQNMIGYFANLVTLRFQYDSAKTFRDWLSAVRLLVSEVQERCEIPHGELRDVLHGLGVAIPHVQIIFHAPVGTGRLDMHFAGLQLSEPYMYGRTTMPWGFSMILDARKRDLPLCRAVFNAEIYDPTSVRRFIGRLFQCLRAASRRPDLPMGLISGIWANQ